MSRATSAPTAAQGSAVSRRLNSAAQAAARRRQPARKDSSPSAGAGAATAGRSDAAALAEGQAATQRLLVKAFEKLGISELNPVGQPFDANQHEAMAMQPSDTAEPNSVLAVVQRGYVLNGRLLRPARVIVARAP